MGADGTSSIIDQLHESFAQITIDMFKMIKLNIDLIRSLAHDKKNSNQNTIKRITTKVSSDISDGLMSRLVNWKRDYLFYVQIRSQIKNNLFYF